MSEYGCSRIVYSSSATVYGTPPEIPIPETTCLQGHSPYARSKVMSETIIEDLCQGGFFFFGGDNTPCLACKLTEPSSQSSLVGHITTLLQVGLAINGADLFLMSFTALLAHIHQVLSVKTPLVAQITFYPFSPRWLMVASRLP